MDKALENDAYDDSIEEFGIDELILKDMYDAIAYFKNTSNTTLLG